MGSFTLHKILASFKGTYTVCLFHFFLTFCKNVDIYMRRYKYMVLCDRYKTFV